MLTEHVAFVLIYRGGRQVRAERPLVSHDGLDRMPTGVMVKPHQSQLTGGPVQPHLHAVCLEATTPPNEVDQARHPTGEALQPGPVGVSTSQYFLYIPDEQVARRAHQPVEAPRTNVYTVLTSINGCGKMYM